MLTFFIYLEFTAAKVKPATQVSQHTVTCCVPPLRTESWGAEKLGPGPQTTAAPGYASSGTFTALRNQALSPSHGAANSLFWVSKPPSKIWSLILLWSLTFLQLPTSSHHRVPPGGRTGARSKHSRGAVVSFQLQGYSIKKPVTYCQKAPLIPNPSKYTEYYDFSTSTFQLQVRPANSHIYLCTKKIGSLLHPTYMPCLACRC